MRLRPLRPARLPASYAYGILALLSILLAVAALVLSSNHTNATATRLDRQASVQAATIMKLDATVRQLRAQQLAACGSAGDIGSIPIPARPRPSKLAISLVTDSRAEWRALHCPGTLPSAQSLGLAKWAKAYHLNPS